MSFSHDVSFLVDKPELVRRKKKIIALCITSTCLILAGTLWPYNPFPPNRVSWLPGARGIEFKRAGVVVSDHPLKVENSEDNQSCSLELLVRSAGLQSVKTILSFYARRNPRQFQLGQTGKALWILSEFLDAGEKRRVLRFAGDEAFAQGQLVLITITSGPDGTFFYKNGHRAGYFSRVRVSPTDWTGQIVLGTSPQAYAPWEGEVHGLALYAKELTPEEARRHYINWTGSREAVLSDLNGAIAAYTFGEGRGRVIHSAVAAGPNLQIPRIFQVPYKPILQSPAKEFELTHQYVKSIFLNIAIFAPLGYFFCAYWMLTKSSKRAVLWSILSAGLLSLTIEVVQAYIPMRFSGMTDVLTNTVGASFGAVLMQRGWFAWWTDN